MNFSVARCTMAIRDRYSDETYGRDRKHEKKGGQGENKTIA